MALGTLASAIAAPVIAGGVGYGLNRLFGPSSGSAQAPLTNFAPPGINAGGFNTSFAGGNVHLTASPERTGLVQGVSDTFGQLGGELGMLRARVAPGMSDLRSSRLAEIEDARGRAIGDLRENLARRRVLGSSFGSDAIARAESEFGGARERVAAESTLQELEMTNNLVNQQFQAFRQQFQTHLDELNLEAGIASGLAGKATEALGANARMLAQLNMLEQQSSGRFFGQMFQPAFNAIGNAGGRAVGSYFGQGGINTGTLTSGGTGIVGIGPIG